MPQPTARKCRECGKPHGCTAQVVPGTGPVKEATWDFYHLRCWRKATKRGRAKA